MKSLSETWFVDGYIDFEQKKYRLLDYLQTINRYFDQNKLYPQLSDIIFHFNNLIAFRENKQYLQQQFPKRLSQIDLNKLQVIYEKMVTDDELMDELEDIIRYAMEEMEGTIKGGKEIYDFVEEEMDIAPVGIIPLSHEEGYMFVNNGVIKETRVYEFHITLFEKQHEKYRAMRTLFVDSWLWNFVNTHESIKSELIRKRVHLPNPATYSVITHKTFPWEETLLPVAKRTLVKYISDEAA
ncbi:MAG TPA: hypothetical protein VFX43_21150 [Chitinophagaceae bacterium]|jgi:hypothetical protein|nr:hypothetical protein [Chitinophagaceae bacterium]